MSLLSTFVATHLITALEHSLVQYEPQAQQAILNDLKVFGDELASWLATKLEKKES